MYSLTDRKTIEYLCNKYDFRFKKGLGQNFLRDEEVLAEIVRAAQVSDSGVLEIGPGFGTLTCALATAAKKVVAVEIDERMLPVLSETLAGFDNIEIINTDILKCDIAALLADKFGDERVSVAANLPYYITTPIIMKLLENRLPLKNIVVMVQREVADRICADAGCKDYGAVTVAVNYYCKPEVICGVDRNMFTPSPNVDSAVLRLEPRSEPPARVEDEKVFFDVVRASFSQRRKTLLNALKNSGKFGTAENVAMALDKAEIDRMIRGERLSIADFAKLSNIFVELKKI